MFLTVSDLDRKVAEEWRRLQEVREAVCRDHRSPSRESSPEEILNAVQPLDKDAYVQLNKDFFVLSSCRQMTCSIIKL